MSINSELPTSLQEAITYFASPERSLAFMVALRWGDGEVTCPWCSAKNARFMESRQKWKCRDCRKQFSVKVGTIFEDSPLKLETWLPAVWLIVNAKNGISSCELARALDVTQKTAWFMLHRIRLAMQAGTVVKTKSSGVVEADESYIGGLARNMHKDKKAKITGTGGAGKTAVMALLDRHTKSHSRIVAHGVVKGTPAKRHADSMLEAAVHAGSEINTDQASMYQHLYDKYQHEVINHAEAYVRDGVHTNCLENFWCLLKRSLKGTYVSVEPFHLFRYLSEQVFRFNERRDENGDGGRFLTAMAGIIGKRVTWKQLTGKGCDPDGLPVALV